MMGMRMYSDELLQHMYLHRDKLNLQEILRITREIDRVYGHVDRGHDTTDAIGSTSPSPSSSFWSRLEAWRRACFSRWDNDLTTQLLHALTDGVTSPTCDDLVELFRRRPPSSAQAWHSEFDLGKEMRRCINESCAVMIHNVEFAASAN